MRAALIHGGVVANVIIVGEDFVPPTGYELLVLEDDQAVAPGWLMSGGDRVVPPVDADPPTAVILDPALVEAWQDATTIAQLRAAGVKLFAALGVTT